MKNVQNKLRVFINSLTLFKIVAILIIIYVSILIFKEIRPQTLFEKKMHCLELSGDNQTLACFKLITKQL